MLLSDTSKPTNQVIWKYGYEVRELKESIQEDKPKVICCENYWSHYAYLDEFYNVTNLFVWQSFELNWQFKTFPFVMKNKIKE